MVMILVIDRAAMNCCERSGSLGEIGYCGMSCGCVFVLCLQLCLLWDTLVRIAISFSVSHPFKQLSLTWLLLVLWSFAYGVIPRGR